jgi:acyl-CoA hydrolase
MKTNFTMRFLALPSAVNFGGKVHGGTVMSWIDQAVYACATAYSSLYCVTVFVGGVKFIRPIKIGAVVEVDAKPANWRSAFARWKADCFQTGPHNS